MTNTNKHLPTTSCNALRNSSTRGACFMGEAEILLYEPISKVMHLSAICLGIYHSHLSVSAEWAAGGDVLRKVGFTHQQWRCQVHLYCTAIFRLWSGQSWHTHTYTHTTVTSCHHRTPSTHAHANKPHHFLCLSLRHLRTRFSSRGERQKTEQVNDACFPFLAHDWHNDTDVWIGHIKVTFRTRERTISSVITDMFHSVSSNIYQEQHKLSHTFLWTLSQTSLMCKSVCDVRNLQKH